MTPQQQDDVRTRAQRWIEAEPDTDVRDELVELLNGDPGELAARFDGRLQFGTAGLRGPIGAGPLRMNRLVVRQAAAGLVEYLLETVPAARERGIVVGYDARRKSDLFALDTARVAAARDMKVYLYDQRVATPVLAWSIAQLGAAAGVVVTASHNPPADNGYKVYLDDGSQIVSPVDADIAAHIDRFDPTSVPLAESDDRLIETVSDEMVQAYVEAAPRVRFHRDVYEVSVAYTALHGVGGDTVRRVFEAAGFDTPIVVEAQQEPDGGFPTVSFPNPEEPGAMDAVIELASSSDADIAIANDPDADRLGVAIPQPDGTWRRLAGDEIGWLMADYILSNTEGGDRMVVTTLVSSALLAKMADAHGVASEETFTGFKWIAHTIREHPDHRFVFGYEQALGYLVTDRPRDKDGITAALLMAELAAVAKADGYTLQMRLDEIAARYGRHTPAEKSIAMAPQLGAERVAAIRAKPPQQVGGRAVLSVTEYPEANLVRFELDGGVRVQLRPSGTEPKVKIYGEAVDADPAPYVDALAALLTEGG